MKTSIDKVDKHKSEDKRSTPFSFKLLPKFGDVVLSENSEIFEIYVWLHGCLWC